MKKNYSSYFKSTAHINSRPPYSYKIFIPHCKVSFAKLAPPFIKGGGGVQTMDFYVETNIHQSILCSPPLPILRVLLPSFPTVILLWPPPPPPPSRSLWKFWKIPLPLLIPAPTTIKYNRVKELIFSRFAGLQPVVLLIHELLNNLFVRILPYF